VNGLYVEYAGRRMKYGILFMFSPFYEYSNLEYGCVPVYYSVQNVIRILVAAPPPLC